MSDIKIPLGIYDDFKRIIEDIHVKDFPELKSEIKRVKLYIYEKNLLQYKRDAYAKHKSLMESQADKDKQDESRREYLKLKQDYKNFTENPEKNYFSFNPLDYEDIGMTIDTENLTPFPIHKYSKLNTNDDNTQE